MVPREPRGWVPRRVPDVEGVARTLRFAVAWTRSLRMNLVERGGVILCVVPFAILEYPERFPAASVALTRYLYTVAAVRPVSEYELDEGVPT